MLCIEDWVAPLNLAELSLHAALRHRSSMLCIEDWWPPLYGGHPYSKEYGGRHANLALLSLGGLSILGFYTPLYTPIVS